MQEGLTAHAAPDPAGDGRNAAGPAAALSRLVVTGFLGTGKSHVIEKLTGARDDAPAGAAPFRTRVAGTCAAPGGQILQVVEASPFQVPAAAAGQIVVTTVDAVNAAANLADADLRALVAGQVRAADIVVLTCGDVADPGPALHAIAALTDAPVIGAHAEADLAQAILTRQMAVSGAPRAAEDHSAAFTIWSYSGSAVLTDEAMAAFVAQRPAGAYRIRGTVMLHGGGGRIDVFGRGRRTSAVERPAVTDLVVAGPAGRLSTREMDLAFAEAVAAAAYGRGVIACR